MSQFRLRLRWSHTLRRLNYEVPESVWSETMTRKAPKTKPSKTAVVAFKVEEELADLLNKLPNKSAFIRKAIEAQLGMACPLCNGKGVVPRGVHDHYAPLIKQHA